LLISLPLTSVILGFLMLWLGLQTNNSMVVDDYYKEGKAINQRIARDQAAAILGVQASLRAAPDGLALTLTQLSTMESGLTAEAGVSADSGATAEHSESTADAEARRLLLPDSITVRWVHATQASRDGSAVLTSIGGGHYVAPDAAQPGEGRWRWHVEPATGDWRLVSDMLTIGNSLQLTISPPELAQFSGLSNAE
jgi:hypothetical protein